MTTLIIFAVLIGFILLGVPVAVAMGLTAVLTFLAMGQADILTMTAQRMYASTTSFTLLAIPFFILAGNLMNTGGITERIFRFAKALVGHVWGGLGQVNIIASMIFSGMSGAAVADAAGLGMIEMKAMKDNGYDWKFSAAITAASSTIGPVIPPSIPFVIYGHLTGVSVGRLFLAGVVPGVLMGVALMVAVYFVSKHRNYPREEHSNLKEIISSGKDAALPLGTPVIIIGGILSGQFTPTEASVVACLYALFLSLAIYRSIHIKDLPAIFWDTLTHTIRIMFIIASAGFFGWLLILHRIPAQVITSLTAVSSNYAVVMLLIIAVLLLFGCFLEGIAVLLITIPIFQKIIAHYMIDPVQFGVVMTLASMIGLLTPPVGMCLYAVSSITGVSIGELTKEMWPYLLGIFLVLLAVAFIPEISLWLPNLLMGRVMSMKNFLKFLTVLDPILVKGLRLICLVCFALLLILLAGNVFVRYVPIMAFYWFDEVVEWAFAWMVFCGAAALWARDDHFKLEWFPTKMQGTQKGRLVIAGLEMLSFFFLFIFATQSLRLTILAKDWTPVFNVSKRFLYVCMPISGFIMLGYSARNVVREVRAFLTFSPTSVETPHS
jgi:C4-dicarboxylate transporter DctM subunit